MMMRVMLDGVFFTQWDGTLESFVSMQQSMGMNIDISRVSWHPDDWAGYQAQLRAEFSVKVDAERDRRLRLGVTFNGKQYQSDERSLLAITRNGTLAFIAIAGGADTGNLRWASPDEDFAWIATDNTQVAMDAPTMLDLSKAASSFERALVFKGRALKDLGTMPADYTDNKWW